MGLDFNGIDVSHWQGTIDWKKVYDSGVRNAIIKLGGSDAGTYTDKSFERNYTEARKNGLRIGVYWFTGKNFCTVEDGIREAEECIKRLGDRVLDYPIYCDIEAQPTDKNGITQAVMTFCGTIHDKYGRAVGVYGSDIAGFRDRMDIDAIQAYPYISIWVARYGSAPRWVKKFDIWQSSSNGSVPGISGRVDTDVFQPSIYSEIENDISVISDNVEAPTQPVSDDKAKNLATKIYEVIKDYL